MSKHQFVEWKGKCYDCAQNSTINNSTLLSCTTMASPQHAKCQCQKMYLGRTHLMATCNPHATLLAEPLTYDYCMRQGYLVNDSAANLKQKQKDCCLQRTTIIGLLLLLLVGVSLYLYFKRSNKNNTDATVSCRYSSHPQNPTSDKTDAQVNHLSVS
jgi:hypothetical protein